MRPRTVILLSCITLSITVAVFFWIRGMGEEELEPVIDPPPALVTLSVLHGKAGELEVVLMPFMFSPQRDVYMRRRWNDALESPAGTPPWRFLRLWLINHGKETVSLPADGLAALAVPGLPDWRARSLTDLASEAHREVSPGFMTVITARSLGDTRELAAGSWLDLVIAVPAKPSLEDMNAVEFRGLDSLRLGPVQIEQASLLEYEDDPKGLIESLVIYSGRDRTDPTEREHAERGR